MDKIKRAIEAFDVDVESVKEVSNSFSSTVRVLELRNGEKVVLKIPFSKTKLCREERVLKLFSDNNLIPDLLDIWYGDEENCGALLMSYIDGEPMVLPVDDKIIYETGRVLAMLHSVKIDMFELDEISNDWWGSIKSRFNIWMEEIEGYIPESLIHKSYKYFENQLSEFQNVDGPRLIHFDFRPGNILVRDGEIVGLIDFESSRGGSTDIDFIKIAEYLWKEYPSAKWLFLDGYSSVRELPDIEKNLPLYTFFNAIGGIAWCIRRGKLEDEFFYENLSKVKECLQWDN